MEMLRWHVGRATITPIVEMELPVPATAVIAQATPEALRRIPWLHPHFVDDDHAILKLSVQSLLVETPDMKVIVDTCVGNDRPREITGGETLHTAFLHRMREAGWPRESLDAVVCTHLHVDHVGWNTMLENGAWVPTFPNARYLITKHEYEYWRAYEDEEQQAMLGDSIDPIVDAGLADFVALDHIISPEIRLFASTGHTPGHVSVLIESDGEQAVITGDMMHHPSQFAHPEWSFDRDPKGGNTTRARLFEQWADDRTLIIGTHFPAPTAGRIRRDGEAFAFVV